MGTVNVLVACMTIIVFGLTLSEETSSVAELYGSKFEYEYKVLQRLAMFEIWQKQFGEKFDVNVAKLSEQMQQLETMEKRLEDHVYDGQGSTYVRWGKKTCPSNGTEMVYSGYAGGSWYYNHPGGAANHLCMSSKPKWKKFVDGVQTDRAYVYGTEYQLDHSENIFGKTFMQYDAPCAVCRSKSPTSIMIPGTTECNADWKLEYSGYLAAGYHTNKNGPTEYICLDGEPDVLDGGHSNDNGRLLYFVEGRCGALRCPPYIEGRELTCVVCTK